MADDVFDQIAGRELEGEFGPRTPLRRFKGKLEQLEARKRADDAQFPGTDVFLHFTNVEVIEATEPYDFPIAEVRIGKISNKEKSFWGIFEASYLKLITPRKSLKELLGATTELAYTPGHVLWDGRQQKDVAQGAWEMVGVGVVPAKVTATEQALRLLDGKTLQQFNQAALSDLLVRSDTTVQSQIMKSQFIPQQIEAKAVTVDSDGVHHTN